MSRRGIKPNSRKARILAKKEFQRQLTPNGAWDNLDKQIQWWTSKTYSIDTAQTTQAKDHIKWLKSQQTCLALRELFVGIREACK